MQEIRFIRHSLSSDITDAMGDGNQARGSMELVVKIKSAQRFPFERRIRRCLNGKRKVQELIELEETRFVYDNVKIVVKVGGRDRTVDLGNPKRLRATFDVTDRVQIGRGGHPRFESISEVAHEIMHDLENQLYGKG